MAPTINKLRIEVTANNLGKMQHVPLFDRINIVLDQCPSKVNRLIQGYLTIHSNIYGAIFALFYSSLKVKASPKGLKIKKKYEGRGHARRMCHHHERFFGRVAY